MQLIKKLVLIVIVLVALLLGALIIFAATFDANHYKPQLIEIVNKATGRNLEISGPLKLSVYPDIALDMKQATLSNASGFADKRFAQIESASLSVRLVPLLKKQLQVKEVKLEGLTLNLHRNSQGATNWDDLLAKPQSATQQEAATSTQVMDELMANLQIAGIDLENAQINWRDEQNGKVIQFAPVNLETGVFRPGKALPVTVSLKMKQSNPPINLALDGSTTVSLDQAKQQFSLKKLQMKTRLDGAPVPGGELIADLSGSLSGNASTLSSPGFEMKASMTGDSKLDAEIRGALRFDVDKGLLDISGLNLNATMQGKLLQGGKLKADARGHARYDLNANRATLDGLTLNGDLQGGWLKTGKADGAVTANAVIDLATQQVTLNNLKLAGTLEGELLQNGKATTDLGGTARINLAQQQAALEGMQATIRVEGPMVKGGTVESRLSGDTQLNLANRRISASTLATQTTVQGGLVPGGALTQQGQGALQLDFGANTGQISFDTLKVKLADLAIQGSAVTIKPLAQKPAISGQFKTNSFSPRKLMKVLGMDVPATRNPAALGKAQAQFGINADSDAVALDNLNLTLDQSTISGRFSLRSFTAPVIEQQLRIDRLNLDDYLAPEASSAAQVKPGSPQNAGLLPLALLSKLTMQGDLAIGSLLVNKLTMSSVSAAINAKQGLIRLDPTRATLYKGDYVGKVTIDTRQKVPTLAMRHELKGLRSEDLLFDLFSDRYVSGNTLLVTELTSRGNTVDALLANLGGETKIEFRDGTIRDSNFAKQTALAVKVFEKEKVRDGQKEVTFTKLAGDWVAKNGVFSTDNLSMLAPYFEITGKGTADIIRQTLDLHLRIGPKSKPGERTIFAPLRVYGPIASLKYQLELDELIKSIAAEDLKQKEAEIRQRVEQEKEELKAKLEAKKAEELQRLEQIKEQKAAELKARVAEEKEQAIQKLKDKTGEQLGEKLGEQLRDKVDGKAVDDIQDKVKDALKDRLKGLF